MDLTTTKLDTELVKFILAPVSDTHITIPIGECPSYQTQLLDKLEEVYNKTLTDTPFLGPTLFGNDGVRQCRTRYYFLADRIKERFTSQIIPLVEKLENKSTEMSTEYEKTITDLKEQIGELKLKLKENDKRVYDMLENHQEIGLFLCRVMAYRKAREEENDIGEAFLPFCLLFVVFGFKKYILAITDHVPIEMAMLMSGSAS